MARTFKLPDLGEGIHEGEIIEILVSVGDKVEEGDDLLVVETDKASVEIPSPFTGEVTGIEVEPGELVKVGDTIVSFSDEEGEAEGAEAEEAPAEPEEEADTAAEEERKERAAEEAEEPPEEERKEEPEEKEPEAEPEREAPPEREGPVPAAPSTRRLARELGVDLRQVPPSGPAGRVTSEDVRAYAEKGKEEVPAPEEAPREREAPERAPGELPEVIPHGKLPSLPDFTRWGEVERQPLRSVRRSTAKQMALSWGQIPHVNHQDEADITELERFRERHKQEIEEQGGKLTPTVFAMKAAVTALKTYPRFNASIDPENEEIILKNYYHIGIAVDTERGLLVPIIRDVDQKSITQLSIELNEMVQRTRAGETSLEELKGGTFTITNIGILGGTAFFPIINFPEVAIMGMAKASWEPVVQRTEEGEFETEPRYILPLMLAFDHRVVDGADAARFMGVVKDALESPENLLLTM
jgi:pyruvate dehydrogenase E2 component (dihydrolipoamide acetyltransferase)